MELQAHKEGGQQPKRNKTIILLTRRPGHAHREDGSLLAAGILLQLKRTQQNNRCFVALGWNGMLAVGSRFAAQQKAAGEIPPLF